MAQALTAWDGKSAADIQVIYQDWIPKPGALDAAIALVTEGQQLDAATWLLKHHAGQKETFSTLQTNTLIDALPLIDSWPSRLHILQAVPAFTFSAGSTLPLETFARVNLTHTNKMVRAWAYNALFVIAGFKPELQDDVLGLFEMAQKDEPASVQARIRQCLKQGFPTPR